MGAMDPQTLNRLRHEQSLDRWFGPESREYPPAMEPQGQMMAQQAPEAGQPQPDPRQMQALMAARQSAPAGVPFDAIRAQIMMQPGMPQHLEGIDLDGDGVPDTLPMGPPPMDPMGRMQWQQMMDQRQQMAQANMQRKAQRKAVNNVILMKMLQANDPLFEPTHQRLMSYIGNLPSKVRVSFLRAVESTPGAFLDLYTHIRPGVERAFGSYTHVPMPQPGNADPRARIRQAVAGRMSPPVLEAAGVYDDRSNQASRQAERAALVKRMKAGGAREGDNLRLLELSGL
jgi:hypothetical protein